MDAKEYVQFDQYQRYMTTSRVIDYWREKEGNASYRILDFGSNENALVPCFRGMAQFGSALGLGPRVPQFESGYPDLAFVLILLK